MAQLLHLNYLLFWCTFCIFFVLSECRAKRRRSILSHTKTRRQILNKASNNGAPCEHFFEGYCYTLKTEPAIYGIALMECSALGELSYIATPTSTAESEFLEEIFKNGPFKDYESEHGYMIDLYYDTDGQDPKKWRSHISRDGDIDWASDWQTSEQDRRKEKADKDRRTVYVDKTSKKWNLGENNDKKYPFFCKTRANKDTGSNGVQDGLVEFPAMTCSHGSFPCPSGGCIPGSRVCDGVRDCGGGEDEEDCAKTLCEDIYMEKYATKWLDDRATCIRSFDLIQETKESACSGDLGRYTYDGTQVDVWADCQGFFMVCYVPRDCAEGWTFFKGKCYRILDVRTDQWGAERLCGAYDSAGHEIPYLVMNDAQPSDYGFGGYGYGGYGYGGYDYGGGGYDYGGGGAGYGGYGYGGYGYGGYGPGGYDYGGGGAGYGGYGYGGYPYNSPGDYNYYAGNDQGYGGYSSYYQYHDYEAYYGGSEPGTTSGPGKEEWEEWEDHTPKMPFDPYYMDFDNGYDDISNYWDYASNATFGHGGYYSGMGYGGYGMGYGGYGGYGGYHNDYDYSGMGYGGYGGYGGDYNDYGYGSYGSGYDPYGSLEQYSELLTPSDNEENEFILNLALKDAACATKLQLQGAGLWLGTKFVGQAMGYSNWEGFQQPYFNYTPWNQEGECIYMNVTTGYWNTTNCYAQEFAPVCVNRNGLKSTPNYSGGRYSESAALPRGMYAQYASGGHKVKAPAVMTSWLVLLTLLTRMLMC